MRSCIMLFMMGVLMWGLSDKAHAQQCGAKEAEIDLFVESFRLVPEAEQNLFYDWTQQKKACPLLFVYDKELKRYLPGVTPENIALIRTKAMFSTGKTPQLPIFVRRDSEFYKTIMLNMDLYSKGGKSLLLIQIRFAAKISHEISHLRTFNKGEVEDEINAIRHEKAVFDKLVETHRIALKEAGLVDDAQSYSLRFVEDLKAVEATQVAKGS